jgi:hypothetical protein
MTTVQKKESIPPRYWSYFLIIASVLIGYGVGLLAGYPGSGLFIGLGLGILGSSFMHPVEHVDGVAVVPPHKSHWAVVLAGIFFIIVGMGIVLALWPYIIAVLIILLGIWILVHGFVKPYYISMRK